MDTAVEQTHPIINPCLTALLVAIGADARHGKVLAG
jgi:hypothetical protein